MGFMSEISEELGEKFAYKNVLNKMNQLQKDYSEKYGSDIIEMYTEIFEDLKEYLVKKM